MKVPVVTSDDYILYFELYETYTFIHCDCFRWSKMVKKHLEKDLDLLASIHRKDIYAIHETNDKKHLKFIEMLKFVFVKDIISFDNIERQLFVRKYHGN